jgi:hypothetical protein
MTESALYQQVASIGPRNPTTILLCQLGEDKIETAGPQPLHGNRLFSLMLDEDKAADQLMQALSPLLSSQLCIDKWPLVQTEGVDLLQVSSYRLDSKITDTNLQAQLELVFGEEELAPQDDPLSNAPDLANYLLHRRWGQRNLALGNRQGAIRSFNHITALDDGDPMANFWLSRLLSSPGHSKATYEQAIRRAELLHNYVIRLHPEMKLLDSLSLLHQARALHHLQRYDQALETVQKASGLCAHQEVLEELVRMSLQKLVRDNELQREHVAHPLLTAIDALEELFLIDHVVYYRFMRSLRSEFSQELLSRLNQKVTEKLQKACVPLYRSESEITLFYAEQLQQPLLSPGNAKPLPPWQQLQRARISSEDQLLLLQYSADRLQDSARTLADKRAHLADLEKEEHSLDSRIEQGHQLVVRQKKNIKGARIATIGSLMLMIGSAGLYWWSSLDRSLAWIPFIAFFVFTVLFALTWKRQGEHNRSTVAEMQGMEQKLSRKLDDVNHSPVTLDGLFERLDYLASKTREHLGKVRSEVTAQETSLRSNVKRFIDLVCGYEEALGSYYDKFDSTATSKTLEWKSGEQPLLSLLPEELDEFQELETVPMRWLVCKTASTDNNRAAVYFSGSRDTARFEQLKANPGKSGKKDQRHDEGSDNVVEFRPKLSLPESAEK